LREIQRREDYQKGGISSEGERGRVPCVGDCFPLVEGEVNGEEAQTNVAGRGKFRYWGRTERWVGTIEQDGTIGQLKRGNDKHG